MAVPTKLISTSQAFQDAKGNVVANGFLMLQLSQNAEVTASGGQVTTQALWLPLDANGKITSTAIWFNDELSPAGTVYYAKLFGSNGMLQIQDFGGWSISGASADLSTVVPTSPSVGVPGVVLLAPAANQNIVQPTGTSLNVNRFENIRFADQFSGASVGAKIDAACSDLGSNHGLVIIPSNMGSGNSLVGIPDNIIIWDFRGISGPNEFGNEGVAYLKDVIFRARWTAAAGQGNQQTLHLHAEPFAGGTNTTGTKSNYSGAFVTMDARTPGQHVPYWALVNNFSGQGDTVAFAGFAFTAGRNNAAGDEGVEGITVQANHSLNVPTGTVSAIATNLITLSPVTNGSSIGEQRPLINTNAAKIYSTGTITSIAGIPPTVTGNGTTWATQFGAGAKTNLFFALDADVNGSYKLVVPVRSITNDTTLILDYVSEGVDANYPINGSGTYKIYKGSNVTGVTWAASGAISQVTVADGTQFTNADTVEQPLGYATGFMGAHVVITPQIRPGSNTGAYGIAVVNNQSVISGNGGLSISGPWVDGIQFVSGPYSRSGIRFEQGTMSAGPLLQSADNTNNGTQIFLQGLNNASAARNFSFNRANDEWTIGSNAANFSGADSRVAFGTDIVANTAHFLSYSNVAWDGLKISGASTQNNGVFPFSVNQGGIPIFYVKNNSGATTYEVVVNNSQKMNFYSGNQAILTAQIDSGTGKASTYNSVATAGNGLASVHGATSQKAETAADTNVLTFTPPAAAGTYRITFVLSLSAANAATLGWTATWKDSNGAAQAPTNMPLQQTGVAAPALTFTTSVVANYYGSAVIDVDNSATAIVIKLTFAGTSFAGKVSATIERLI